MRSEDYDENLVGFHSMKVMITGAAGFIGGHLTRYCLGAGDRVLGLDVEEQSECRPGADFELCDVRDSSRLQRLIAAYRPDCIYHLAAQSYPTVSLAQPRETMDVNVGGTINLFESLRTAGISPLVIVGCSSAEYGRVIHHGALLREDDPLCPLHPYGVSKVAQDLLAAQYFANYSIPALRIRIFNTTGPGKMGDVCSDLTRRAVEIELGLRSPVLPVGNRTRRAIVDVRDLVRGLWLSAERCIPGEVYNLGSDRTHSLDEIVAMIQALSQVPFEVEQVPGLMRSCDEPVIAGNMNKFRECSGWKAELDLANTLSDMLDWWRQRIHAEPRCGSQNLHPPPRGTILNG